MIQMSTPRDGAALVSMLTSDFSCEREEACTSPERSGAQQAVGSYEPIHMSRCLMFRIKFHKLDETLDLTAQRVQLYKPGAHWSGSFFASDDRQVAVFP